MQGHHRMAHVCVYLTNYYYFQLISQYFGFWVRGVRGGVGSSQTEEKNLLVIGQVCRRECGSSQAPCTMAHGTSPLLSSTLDRRATSKQHVSCLPLATCYVLTCSTACCRCMRMQLYVDRQVYDKRLHFRYHNYQVHSSWPLDYDILQCDQATSTEVHKLSEIDQKHCAETEMAN